MAQGGGNGRGAGAEVRLSGVTHSFNGAGTALEVLKDIDLTVRPGETVAIVGPSGSGKSTLFNMIMGRLTPTGGRVAVTAANGERPRLAVVFQDPALLPWLDVVRNISLPLELEGQTEGARDKALAALDRIGLADFAAYRPHQLSGGMQSRVALARALVHRPDLLLLDEPFGSLDEATGEAIMADLEQLIEELGTTVLLITHSLLQAAYLADRVVVLSARPGRMAASVDVEGRHPRSSDFQERPAFLQTLGLLRQSLKEAVHGSPA
jgi:NitT/TauT family transport system ATP-binding protein